MGLMVIFLRVVARSSRWGIGGTKGAMVGELRPNVGGHKIRGRGMV